MLTHPLPAIYAPDSGRALACRDRPAVTYVHVTRKGDWCQNRDWGHLATNSRRQAIILAHGQARACERDHFEYVHTVVVTNGQAEIVDLRLEGAEELAALEARYRALGLLRSEA